MPRYRTIACDNCGQLVLKRDQECERCGASTPQAKRRMEAQAIYFLVVVIAIGLFYLHARSTILSLGVPAQPTPDVSASGP